MTSVSTEGGKFSSLPTAAPLWTTSATARNWPGCAKDVGPMARGDLRDDSSDGAQLGGARDDLNPRRHDTVDDLCKLWETQPGRTYRLQFKDDLQRRVERRRRSPYDTIATLAD